MTTDDLLRDHPDRLPPRPKVGLAPRISDARVLTLAVMQVLLGYSSERRWLRYARQHLQVMFPALPGQSGYNKRVRKLAATMTWLVRELGAQTTVASDEVWQLDLEAPGGRTTLGVCARIAQRVLALTTAIWHNDKLGLPTRRSLTAYDH